MKKLLTIILLAATTLVRVNAQTLASHTWTNQVSSYWDNVNAWSPVFGYSSSSGWVYSWNLNSTYSAPISATLRTTMGDWQPDGVAIPFATITVGSNMTVIVDGVALVASNLSLTGNAALWLTGGGSYTNGGSFSWNPTSNGSIILNNGSMPNLGTLTIGGYNNSIAISNGSTFAQTGPLTVGNGGTSSNNSYLVGGLGAFSSVSNGNIILNGLYNTMNVTNANFIMASAGVNGFLSIGGGDGASNNTVTVLANGTMNIVNPASYFYIGQGNLSGSNAMIINGGIVTNTGGIYIGQGGGTSATGSSGNSLTVSNGGWLMNTANAITLGRYLGDNSNSFNVGGLGAASVVSNYKVNVGAAGAYNTMTITNATLSTSALNGANNSNNTFTVFAGGYWNMVGGISIGGVGTGPDASNAVTINGGVVTNASTVSLGNGGGTPSTLSIGNSLTVSNGGQFISSGGMYIGRVAGDYGNSFNVGGMGAASYASNSSSIYVGYGGSNNTLTVTNGTLVMGNTFTIGNGTSNNTVLVQAGGTLSMIGGVGGANSIVGSGASTGNVMIVNGGVVSNVGMINIGYGSGGGVAVGNSLTISNGGTLIGKSSLLIGNGMNDNWNFVTIGGVGVSSFCSNGGVINVGLFGSGNTLTITNAQMVSNGQTLTLGGFGGGLPRNSLSILSGGTLTFIHPSFRAIQMGAGLINILGGTLANVQTITAGGGSHFNAANTTLPASSYSLTAGAGISLSAVSLNSSGLFAMAATGTNTVTGSTIVLTNANFSASVVSGINNWTNSALSFVGNSTNLSAAGANLDSVTFNSAGTSTCVLNTAWSMNTLVNSNRFNPVGYSVSISTATNLGTFIASNSAINVASFIQLGTFVQGASTLRFFGGGTSSITNYFNLDFAANQTTLTNAVISVAGNLTAEGSCQVYLQGGTLALANVNVPFAGYVNSGTISNQLLTVFASDGVSGLVNSGAKHR